MLGKVEWLRAFVTEPCAPYFKGNRGHVGTTGRSVVTEDRREGFLGDSGNIRGFSHGVDVTGDQRHVEQSREDWGMCVLRARESGQCLRTAPGTSFWPLVLRCFTRLKRPLTSSSSVKPSSLSSNHLPLRQSLPILDSPPPPSNPPPCPRITSLSVKTFLSSTHHTLRQNLPILDSPHTPSKPPYPRLTTPSVKTSLSSTHNTLRQNLPILDSPHPPSKPPLCPPRPSLPQWQLAQRKSRWCQFNSVQFKTASMRSERPICAPLRASEVSQNFAFETVPMFV